MQARCGLADPIKFCSQCVLHAFTPALIFIRSYTGSAVRQQIKCRNSGNIVEHNVKYNNTSNNAGIHII